MNFDTKLAKINDCTTFQPLRRVKFVCKAFFNYFCSEMSTELERIFNSLRDACHASPLLYGIPVGFCIVGMTNLLLPGASLLTTSLGWALIFAAVALPSLLCSWCTRKAAWILWGASVVMTVGVIVNCHYYVHIWGCGDAARPILMNLDHWSAWNNALYNLGVDHAVQSDWPAEGYGRFIGLVMGGTAVDIAIPLLFNCFCVLATIALTAAIAAHCTADRPNRSKTALWAIVLMTLMVDLIASGAGLLKDAPVSLATALTAWAALRMRLKSNVLLPLAAVAAAIFITFYVRPNYLTVLIVIVPAMCSRSTRNIGLAAIVVAACVILLAYAHIERAAATVQEHFSAELITGLDDSDFEPQHAAYYEIFSFYFSAPLWKRLLLLPIAMGVQFLIPLPWNWAGNLAFGPFVAIAYFGFCRYFTGLLVAFYLFTTLRRRQITLALRLCLVGLLFYAGAAYIYGGTVSRYGIPLLCLLVPCAAELWARRREHPALRAWLIIGGCGVATALIACYILSA